MIGTGLLAIPALACSSAFVTAELFTFRRAGLEEKVNHAPRFYAVIARRNAGRHCDEPHSRRPDQSAVWSAVLNGVAAVPLLVVITILANKREIMGRWKNSRLANS